MSASSINRAFFHSMVYDVNYQKSATYYELFCRRQKRENTKAQQGKVSEFVQGEQISQLTKLSWLQENSKPTDIPHLCILGPASFKPTTYLTNAS